MSYKVDNLSNIIHYISYVIKNICELQKSYKFLDLRFVQLIYMCEELPFPHIYINVDIS